MRSLRGLNQLTRNDALGLRVVQTYVLHTVLRVVQVRVTYRVTCSSGACYVQGYV